MAKQLIILTGAGFTNNFGGLLADEMWAMILNHLDAKECNRGKYLMLINDYESVYQYIINNKESSTSEITAFSNALEGAYAFQEKRIQNSIINTNKLPNLSRLICAASSMFFTLNQDLFVENHMYHWLPDNRSFKMPEMDRDPLNMHSAPNKDKLLNRDLIKEIEANPLSLYYMKLHGSMNWKDSNGKHILIIGGKEKIDNINNEPILRLYIECFKHFLKTNEKRLLIIGYGFRDSHINKIIADGIENSLKVYVINKQSFEELRYFTPDKQHSEKIWKGLCGYYKVDSLNEFEINGSANPYFEVLANNLKT